MTRAQSPRPVQPAVGMLFRWTYSVAATLALPFLAAGLLLRKRHRPLLGRFRPPVVRPKDPPLWFHACSVGEVTALRPLLAAARNRWPEISIVLTVSTVAGRKLADQVSEADQVTWFPWDQPWIANSLVNRLEPAALLLTETELWPCLLSAAKKRALPVILVNGRISDRHYSRYARLQAFWRPLLSAITLALVQNDAYKRRMQALGVHASRVRVSGNLKFDGAQIDPDSAALDAFRADLALNRGDLVLLFGSTRPGDESIARDTFHRLREVVPGLRLILAPRHLDRVPQVADLFANPFLRSACGPGKRPGPDQAILLDTHGELATAYALAAVAVIGGSFSSAVQGHNPIEPAALGVPVVFGPHMQNFADPARMLVDAGAAVQVSSASELAETLLRLFMDDAARSGMGARGKALVQANRGAVSRTLDGIAPFVESAGRPR